MKRTIFRISILLFAGITIMTACKKKNDKDNPNNPQRIVVITPDDPNYVGGMTEPESTCITDEHGDTIGTQLSYRSCVDVDGETISYQLKQYCSNVDTSFEDLLYGPYKYNTEYGECSRRQEGNFTIIDSVLVLELVEIERVYVCKWHYEVAVYNDGTAQVVLPYHRPDYAPCGEPTIDGYLCCVIDVSDEDLGEVEGNGGLHRYLTRVIYGLEFKVANHIYMVPMKISSYYVGMRL
ncbi:MAG: hypothetical protein J5606_03655 [Bacteroidales bacterium]|nr:hypothetical protein [Bacteroidales bacterium]